MGHPVIRGNGVVLRPTTPDDLPTARRLFRDPGFYRHWDGYPAPDEQIRARYLGARSPEVESFFVEVAGEVVGFAEYWRATDRPDAGGLDLVLLLHARGRGVGRAVVDAMVRYVSGTLGWRRLTVDPDLSNGQGRAFWAAAGFVPARLVEDEPGREPYWLHEWPGLAGEPGPTVSDG